MIASDGIWEFMSNEKVGEIVKMYWRDEDGITFRRGEKAVDHLIKVILNILK